mmetsp:Transcript_91843/g.264906  ORF Transcript_91843/g.264906 Transcript_91843/m.264906 type:complete len:436 (+) Transcript_91843:86-1393(+)
MGLRSAVVLLMAALTTLVTPAASKVEVVRAVLGMERSGGQLWQYISKFGFGIGTGEFRVRVRQVRRPGEPDLSGEKLVLERHLDERWAEVEAIEDPCDRRTDRKDPEVTVGVDGDWGPMKVGRLSQRIRPHVWYFALSACEAPLPNGTFAFDVEVDARQPDGSHFSVEAAWAWQSSLVTLSLCSALLVRYWRKACRFWSRIGELHPVIKTLAGVIVSQYVAQLLHIGQLVIYSGNGRGAPILEILAEALLISSEVVETSLLLVIAMGYTLTRSSSGVLRLCVPVCSAAAAFHVVLLVLEKTEAEASHKFTGHEGVRGWTTLALRLALFAWFLRAVRSTAAADSSLKVRAFLRQFTLAASAYFLAYPVAFFIVPIFAPYWRRTVMDFGLTAARVCANLWLASLFLDRGVYFEVSALGATLLPGGSPRSCARFAKED